MHRSPPSRPSRSQSFQPIDCRIVAVLVVAVAASGVGAAEPARTAGPANRLAKESSPYLLAHARNPVDWRPWSPESLALAKRENKPIFLSIGYSSCHWCHVMEKESFCDDEIAAALNKSFVCIKVDREERPDVDAIYMTALRVYNELTRSGRGGGWPLSMFLTPDAEPFFGGTYFPARDGDRGVKQGFLTILGRVTAIWNEDTKKVTEDAKTITRIAKAELEKTRSFSLAPLTADLVDGVQEALDEDFDPKYGGFGYVPTNPERPKFPEPSNLAFLAARVRKLRAAGADDAKPLGQLVRSLERMAMGGIRDHLGGGFHRYSVDRFWQIPHFEKMLYDNAQLASAYSEAYALTGRDDFARVVDELLEFVLREMTAADGGFYSAIDADSEGEEGKFYRWEKAEVQKLLAPAEFAAFAPAYALANEPNFEDRFYVPQLEKPFAELAAERTTTSAELEKQLAPLRAKLLKARDGRERPLTDDKILTSWNGLMIRGFADAGRILKNEKYVKVAADAVRSLLKKSRTADGRLRRTRRDGESRLNGYLDDYAFLVDGLIALHRATGEREWLQAADSLTQTQIAQFWDATRGGFFFTGEDHESLLARMKDFTDGAEPSGNSVSADNLIYLGRTLPRPEYLEKARDTIRAGSTVLRDHPARAPRLAAALSTLE